MKSLVRRCETLARKKDRIREEFAIGRGRGQQGFRTHRTLFQAAKDMTCCGRRVKVPKLGLELYQWLVDTVDNIKSRVFGWTLLTQARIIIKDFERYAEEEGVPAEVPAIEGTGWLSRWIR